MIPYVREKIKSLRLKKGRYTFTHDRNETARYAGEMLLHFLKKKGMESKGKIEFGTIRHEDRLIYTYRSRFTLEEILKRMMEFSNNFVANQIFIAVGAKVFGPPGTLAKGVRAVSEFAERQLQLKGVEIAEGSGISRKKPYFTFTYAGYSKKIRAIQASSEEKRQYAIQNRRSQRGQDTSWIHRTEP